MDSFNRKTPFEFSEESQNHLSELRKWALFISILGFIFIGICVFIIPIALFSSDFRGTAGFEYLTIVPLLGIMLIYVFPVYYLYMFSDNSKKAIANSDSNSLEKAVKYLKFHYRFMGILVIIMLGIYLIVGLIMLIVSILKWIN